MSDTLLQDQATLELTVDGRVVPFLIKKRTGGKATSEGSKSPPAGGHTERAHGGRQTVEDVSGTGEFKPSRDHEFIQWLKSRRGKARAQLKEHGTDADGNVWGLLNGWTGVFKEIDTGDYAGDDSSVREFSFEIETDGVIQ
jgi:hypothetical protein